MISINFVQILKNSIHRCNCILLVFSTQLVLGKTQEYEGGHNFCDPNPCQNGGLCQSMTNGFVCICPSGTTGYNCEININECSINSTISHSKCQLFDSDAQCIDLLDGFRCECSAQFTGEFCDITDTQLEYSKYFLGQNDSNMLKLIELITEDPTLFSELAPFFINESRKAENISKLSWTAEDLFIWASFAGRELDLKSELKRWNDPTLGSCFTFAQSGKIYDVADIGENYGFQALMKVNEGDYLPWEESSSLNVFVRKKNEHIFINSPYYSIPPGTEAQLLLSERINTRLGDVYSTCANQTSDVNTFYYPGTYTVIGCLQGCYQNQVHLLCGCTDPRFLGIANISVCGLEKAICILNVTQSYGDPTSWDTCFCPEQCNETAVDALWYSADFSAKPIQCWGNNLSYCMNESNDQAFISIFFRSNIQQKYDEIPARTFNNYLFQAGGITGIIAGFSFISIIEFIFFCYRTFLTFCTNEFVTAEAKEMQFIDEDDADFDVFVEPPRPQVKESSGALK